MPKPAPSWRASAFCAHVARAFAKAPTRRLAYYLGLFAYDDAVHGRGDFATAAAALHHVTTFPNETGRPNGGVQEVETAYRYLADCLDRLGDTDGAWQTVMAAERISSTLAEARRETEELDRAFPPKDDPVIAQLCAAGTFWSGSGTY